MDEETVLNRIGTWLSALAGLLILAIAGSAAAADAYPSKPIRIIVPFPAGGGNDLVARVLAEALRPILGQPLVVENRAGAGGNLGTDLVAKSPPDGYTILHISNGIVVNPYLFKTLPFDVRKDFESLGIVATAPLWILVNANSPITSLADLLQRAKDPKSQLAYASPGAGTPHHFAMELLKSRTQMQILPIQYKGAAPALNDVVGGQLPILISTPAPVSDFIVTGRLRFIATMDPTRSAQYKDVPTVAELVPNFSVTIWHGLMVPAGTPPAITEMLTNALSRVLAMPDVQAKFAAGGFTAKFETPAQMKARIDNELVVWKKVAADAGIVPE